MIAIFLNAVFQISAVACKQIKLCIEVPGHVTGAWIFYHRERVEFDFWGGFFGFFFKLMIDMNLCYFVLRNDFCIIFQRCTVCSCLHNILGMLHFHYFLLGKSCSSEFAQVAILPRMSNETK